MIEIHDDVGRALTLHEPARRIVSLVPSLTELFFSLGSGESVVGVTRYCSEPADGVAEVAKVGGTKNPDLGAIDKLRPELVVVNREENRKEDFDALQSCGLKLFVSFTRTVAEVPSLIRRLGRLCGADVAAELLAVALEDELRSTPTALATRVRPRVFCPIWKNPWMVFNQDTYGDDMLWQAGGCNVYRETGDRYTQVDLADVAQHDPEIILLPDEPYVFSKKDLPSLEPLARTSAGRSRSIHFIDGKALSWYGPRTAAAVRQFRKMLDGGP